MSVRNLAALGLLTMIAAVGPAAADPPTTLQATTSAPTPPKPHSAAGAQTGVTATPGPTASARAFAVRIVFPTGRVVASEPAVDSGSITAPSYSYPGDGSVILTGSTRAASSTRVARAASAASTASASNISIFDGEITADSAFAHATAATASGRAGGAFTGTGAVHLQALGRGHAFGRAVLGDWGVLTISPHTVDRAGDPDVKSFEGVSIGFDVHLRAAHGGLPAGSDIQVGYVEVRAQTAPPVIPNLGPKPGDRPQLLPPVTGPLIGVPQLVEPQLSASPYDFPVYGRSSFEDDYGNARQNQTWQHGVDIFGALGQPLVAVADGTLFSVGWNHASGIRLWLRDRQGNEFLYAHLSAFSTLAANGAHVHAGQVIGFMGDTGNSGGHATHLHFEVHPVSMLFLGFDGAVDPTAYFAGWHRIANLAFQVATGWAPKVPGTIKAPEPGAVLIGSTDISSADGLDPAALRRVLRPTPNG
ncbi:MAG TPA: M23 family metallopeptidase [Gaiellaceae bacterium]|nr:M23 family metallopeptidase [Gaiellaceae bacterium]